MFTNSRLKIGWAKKHIAYIDSLVVAFTSSNDFHSIGIEHDQIRGTNHLRFDINTSWFPVDEIALAIGDTLHNLRSALDLMWYEAISEYGTPTKWTRFPVRDTREELISPLNNALKANQITQAIYTFIIDVVKPYSTGNNLIWSLDELNIWDKHQLVVPVLKLLKFDGVSLENDEGTPIYENFWLMDESCSIRLREADNIQVTVKDKGHATGTILFDLGVPFEGEAVIPSLLRISEEVARTVDSFEAHGGPFKPSFGLSGAV